MYHKLHFVLLLPAWWEADRRVIYRIGWIMTRSGGCGMVAGRGMGQTPATGYREQEGASI